MALASSRAACGLSSRMRLVMRSRSSAASGDQRTSISGLKQPLDACAYVLMGDVFTSIERRQAPLHGFNKAGLFGKRTAKDLARQIVRRAAFLGGKSRELGFLFGRELYFHLSKVETSDPNINFTDEIPASDDAMERGEIVLAGDASVIPRHHVSLRRRDGACSIEQAPAMPLSPWPGF